MLACPSAERGLAKAAEKEQTTKKSMKDGTTRENWDRDIEEEYSLRRTLGVNILRLRQPEYKPQNGTKCDDMGALTLFSPDSVSSHIGCPLICKTDAILLRPAASNRGKGKL